MGKREINQAIKTITEMLEIVTDKKQRAELNKMIKQYKKEWQELDDKATKRQAKKKPIVVQDDTYKPKKITIVQRQRKAKVDIKSAINGIFQDIIIEDDFGYMKEGAKIAADVIIPRSKEDLAWLFAGGAAGRADRHRRGPDTHTHTHAHTHAHARTHRGR
jgi:hypothetical protein